MSFNEFGENNFTSLTPNIKRSSTPLGLQRKTSLRGKQNSPRMEMETIHEDISILQSENERLLPLTSPIIHRQLTNRPSAPSTTPTLISKVSRSDSRLIPSPNEDLSSSQGYIFIEVDSNLSNPSNPVDVFPDSLNSSPHNPIKVVSNPGSEKQILPVLIRDTETSKFASLSKKNFPTVISAMKYDQLAPPTIEKKRATSANPKTLTLDILNATEALEEVMDSISPIEKKKHTFFEISSFSQESPFVPKIDVEPMKPFFIVPEIKERREIVEVFELSNQAGLLMYDSFNICLDSNEQNQDVIELFEDNRALDGETEGN